MVLYGSTTHITALRDGVDGQTLIQKLLDFRNLTGGKLVALTSAIGTVKEIRNTMVTKGFCVTLDVFNANTQG